MKEKETEGSSFMRRAMEAMGLIAGPDNETTEGDDEYTEEELNGTQGNSSIEKE